MYSTGEHLSILLVLEESFSKGMCTMTPRLVEDAATSLVATTYHIPSRGNVSSKEVSF